MLKCNMTNTKGGKSVAQSITALKKNYFLIRPILPRGETPDAGVAHHFAYSLPVRGGVTMRGTLLAGGFRIMGANKAL